jgi:hypothetical protein
MLYMNLKPFKINLILHNSVFSMALPAHSKPWPLINFRNHISHIVRLLGRVISSSHGLYLNTEQYKHKINA